MTLSGIPREVTVAGGGIGGLTAALLLARTGAQVTLLERVAEPTEVGAGLLLQPNGLAVLDALGLAGELAANGHRIGRTELRTGDGTRLLTMAPPDGGPGLDAALAVRRSQLLAALVAAVEAEPRVRTRFGTAVTRARADGTVEHRSPDGDASTRAQLVVGADGAHSAVRAAGRFGARVSGPSATYVRMTVEGADLGVEGEWWTALGLFGGAPLGDGTTYAYVAASAPAVRTALARRDLAALRRAWSRALPVSGPVLDRVGSFDDLLVNDVVRVDCERWVDGRLVLLGDAAHAMAPNLGQGANSAMVDAAVLALELSGRESVAEALRRYDERRRPRVRRVQDASDRMASLSEVRSPARRAVRDAGLRLVGRMRPLAERQGRLALQEDPRRLRDDLTSLLSTKERTR